MLGGRDKIGGNSIFLSSDYGKILLDAGYRIGADHPLPIYANIMRWHDYRELNGVIISHMHLDHYGSLPHLFDKGVRAPIYMSNRSLELYRFVQKKPYIQAGLPTEYVNFIQGKFDQIGTAVKGLATYQLFKCRDMTVTFLANSHMVGAVTKLIETPDHRVLYTGDLGRNDLDHYRDLRDIDLLIFDGSALFREESIPWDTRENLLREIVVLSLEEGRSPVFPINTMGDQQAVLEELDRVAFLERRTFDIVLYGPSKKVQDLIGTSFENLNLISRDHLLSGEIGMAPSPTGGGHVTRFTKGKNSTSIYTLSSNSRRLNGDVISPLSAVKLGKEGLTEKIKKGHAFHIPFEYHASHDQVIELITEINPRVAVPMRYYDSMYQREHLVMYLNLNGYHGYIIFPKIGEEIKL